MTDKPRIRVKAHSVPSAYAPPDVSAATDPANLPVAATSFDIDIPDFLKRDANNVPAFARGEA